MTTTIAVQGGAGYQTYSLGDTFKMVTQVSWTASGVLVDNVVAQDVLVAQTAPAANQIKQFQIAGDVTFNTNTGRIASGSIVIGSTTLTSSSTSGQLTAAGITVTVGGGLARFAFAGDLVIADNVTISATGANALSLYVGNDAKIGHNVSFNVSAVGTTAGAGGRWGGRHHDDGRDRRHGRQRRRAGGWGHRRQRWSLRTGTR